MCQSGNRNVFAGSFSEITNNALEPLHLWVFGPNYVSSAKTNIEEIKGNLLKDVWMTAEARKLEHTLRNCKNQCYRCHLCERTFGLPDIDSAIEL